MGSTELIANLFRVSQTEEKLRKDEITGAKAATATHYKVGKEVRGAIEKIGGTMPEDIPTPEKSTQHNTLITNVIFSYFITLSIFFQ